MHLPAYFYFFNTKIYFINYFSRKEGLDVMRVKLEPETAFIGKKFAYIFLGIILTLNAITFAWYFLFSNLN